MCCSEQKIIEIGTLRVQRKKKHNINLHAHRIEMETSEKMETCVRFTIL